MDESDMLFTKQATDLTGYNNTTINNWATNGKIQAVNYYGKNLISKESLAEYLASSEGQRIRPAIAEISRDYEILYRKRTKQSDMGFGSMSL